jgi:hypothetical protein
MKSFYNSLTNSYRPKIDYIKICQLRFNSNLLGLSIILVIEKKINIYLFQLNPLTFNLISCIKTYIGNLLTIEPVNYIQLFDKETPVLSIISNSEQYNENLICFYSIFNKKELKIIKKKYPILSVSFGTIYFGIGCNHGKIYIHSNSNLDLIFKISEDSIIKVSENEQRKVGTATSVILSKKRKKSNDEEEFDENNEFFDVKNDEYNKKQKGYYNVLFDINNNNIAYEITKDKKVKKEEDSLQNNQQQSVFESIIKGTSKNISKFTEWSFSSFQNINQLRKSYAISTNEKAKKSTSSKLFLSIFNFNSSPINYKYIPNQLLLPYFNEKIGFVKLCDLYLIVGNRENQMFYIFQYFSQTNNKYPLKKEDTKNTYKLIYSIWRGYSGGLLSSFDISNDKRYCILTSKKGTNHIYYLPKRENQIIEIINYPSYSNKEDSGYEKLNEILNMKIINLEEIDKISHNNYNDTEKSLFYSEIIEIDQLHLENNFPDDIKEKIKELNKNKYTNVIYNGRYFIILNDNYAYFYMIFDNNSILKVKKIQLKLTEETGLLEQNVRNVKKNVYYNFAKCNNEKKIEETFDNESTNLSYFSTTQLNPLFSFHTLKEGYKNIDDKDDISFYENICNDLEYTDDKKEKKNKNNIDNIEEKIKEAMSKDIQNIKN